MSPFTAFFLFALIASVLAQWWLSVRQTRYVEACRDRVPAPFADRVSAADHQKAADYTVARERLGRVSLLVDSLILLGLTLGGGIDQANALWQAAGLSQPWLGTAVIVSIVLAQAIVGLPLSLYSTFVIEERFKFNRMTPRLFVMDTLKQLGMSVLLGVPLVAVILFLMDRAGTYWWLYAFGVYTLFITALQWAYPAVFAPWFNKFTPLADTVLLERVQDLLRRCGFKSQGVYTMDGSLRSAHGNAYFTGFGKTKRVVFYDTLIKTLTPSELEGVLAHELGHYRRHHIRNGMILSIVMSCAGFALLGWLTQQPVFFTALGVSSPSSHTALLLFLLALGPYVFWLTPIAAWWSRRNEYEADAFAATHSSSTDLAVALTKLYRDNASTLTPDAWHSAFYDSHPPALARIDNLQRLAARA